MDKLVEKARSLRLSGHTYKQIGFILGLSQPKVWIIINRERYNKNCRDSAARYKARGFKALCET
jgi:hypothetical protein